MKKCILFIRVSSDAQHLESQENSVINEAYKLGYKDSELIKISHKESGSKLTEEERVGLQDLYNVLDKEKHIETVIVFELSRIARKPEIIYKIRDMFIQRKIQLISLKPYMQLLDNDKQPNQLSLMFFSFMIGWSESEIYLKKERTLRSLALKKSEGKVYCGSCPLGYMKQDGYFKPDPNNSKIVIEIFYMYASGKYSARMIGREMKSRCIMHAGKQLNFSQSTVLTILHNKKYLGDEFHPQIVPQELWDKAQASVTSNNVNQDRKMTKHAYYCKNLIYDKNGNKFRQHCSPPSYYSGKVNISINVLDSLIWSLAHTHRTYMSNINVKDRSVKTRIKGEMSNIQKKITYYNNEITKLNERIQTIEERVVFGRLNETKAAQIEETIDRQIESHRSEINSLYAQYNERNLLLQITDEKLAPGYQDYRMITDDNARIKLINEEIKRITIERKSSNEVEIDVAFNKEDEHNVYVLNGKNRKVTLLGIPVDYIYEKRFG